MELTGPGDRDPRTNRRFEPDETDFHDCMTDAKEWFSFRVGFNKIIAIQLSNRQGAFLMPPDCMNVIEMWLPSFQLPSLDADQFSYTYFSLLFGQWTNPNVAPLPYSDLVQRLQYLAMIGRIFTSDRDFEYDPNTRILTIMPAPSAPGSITGVPFGTVVQGLITIKTSQIDVRQLDNMPLNLFKRKLVARAHHRLGIKRSKFSDVASAGGNIQLNGRDLIDTAVRMEEKLEEDVLTWRRPSPIIAG